MESQKRKTIITLGNGQLGLMLQKAARRLGIDLDALSLAEARDYLPEVDIQNTLVTFEQEHVDETLLNTVEAEGIRCFPSMESFQLLRSKLKQKEFLVKHKVPTSPFLSAPKWSKEIKEFLEKGDGGVLKAGIGGYDGKGVWLVSKSGETKDGAMEALLPRIKFPYVEKRVAFDMEAAAVVCRSISGEVVLYPTVKSIQRDGICYQVEYTRSFSEGKAAVRAGEIARLVADKLQYVGVLAVEVFLRGDEVLVNEIAPRVHNSGHFTIDVCAGSQFENHLRAGLGLPLARTEPTHSAALMVNLLWPPEAKEFAPLYTKLTCGPDWPPNVKLHWYGKSEPRPNRKMGHFTVYGEDIQGCHKMADEILASRWIP